MGGSGGPGRARAGSIAGGAGWGRPAAAPQQAATKGGRAQARPPPTRCALARHAQHVPTPRGQAVPRLKHLRCSAQNSGSTSRVIYYNQSVTKSYENHLSRKAFERSLETVTSQVKHLGGDCIWSHTVCITSDVRRTLGGQWRQPQQAAPWWDGVGPLRRGLGRRPPLRSLCSGSFQGSAPIARTTRDREPTWSRRAAFRV